VTISGVVKISAEALASGRNSSETNIIPVETSSSKEMLAWASGLLQRNSGTSPSLGANRISRKTKWLALRAQTICVG
jgi:hypothetical protein